MTRQIQVLLVSGSVRTQSTNTAVLRTMHDLAPPEIMATIYEGLAQLPHFNPDDDDVGRLPRPAATLRHQIRTADAMLFCTPEYAGALPGSFKNMLDWTIGDADVGSIYEKPVAWINTSPRGAVHAHESLRRVLGYAHAVVVEAACVQLPVTAMNVGDDGRISAPKVLAEIAGVWRALAQHVMTESRTAR